MARKSKKKLFEFMTNHTGDKSWQKDGLKHKQVSDETYGKDSRIYISFSSIEEREKMENELEIQGFPVNRAYCKGYSIAEVQVSYFKGHNWDV